MPTAPLYASFPNNSLTSDPPSVSSDLFWGRSVGLRLAACVAVALGPLGWFASTAHSQVAEGRPLKESHQRVDYLEDVQPLLRAHCYRCHGGKDSQGGLRLDVRSAAFGKADSEEPILVPRQAAESLLLQRVSNSKFGALMPLDGQPLTAAEIGVLRRWVEQGAEWPEEEGEGEHWAYRSLRRPDVPVVTEGTAIDQFIQRKLQKHGVSPAPLAPPGVRLRRVSLALTGLPPTPQQVRAFTADPSPAAYERTVDQLLSSPEFGHRWAIPWLDLARYADSNGFQADQLRDNWAYRDWVIRALNSDLPFDEFVIDQLAGDLQPNATLDQRIATGFHRMTTCNVEAGVHPEANRVNQVIDRVNTTATVFMGTTLECAQCHDHKYDPFTQRDYYQLFAYFNNTPLEVQNTSGVTWDFYGPTMALPLPPDLARRQRDLESSIATLEEKQKRFRAEHAAGFDNWLAELRLTSSEQAWQVIVPQHFQSTGKEEVAIAEDGAVLLTGPVPDKVTHRFDIAPTEEPITAIRLELLTDEALPGGGPGRGDAVRRNVVLNEVHCEVVTGEGSEQQVSAVEMTRAAADFSQANWNVSGAIDGDPKSGWAIAPEFGKPHWAAFAFATPLRLEEARQVLRIRLDQHYGRGRVLGKARISVLHTAPRFVDAELVALARKSALSPAELEQLQQAFEATLPEIQALVRELDELQAELEQIEPDQTLVMVEQDEPRQTFVMLRGDYEDLGEPVQPGIPAVFAGASGSGDIPPVAVGGTAGGRLELAEWLTSPANPLLPRVTVNRWWQEVFGRGLVATPEDFGSQAEYPSHPELLDWLASELVESGWSMKHVLKLMVLSHAFQQDAAVSEAFLERDPGNRWLARGPRFRLPAELVRDNALSLSGLLSTKPFGPPIMPYQPSNVWRSVGRNQPKWQAAETEDRFRRGIYVVWKRAAPYPSFVNFDAPNRSSCTVNRPRSNTPLQALTLLNDPAYAEMSLALADRILTECESTEEAARIRFAFELVLARPPSSNESLVVRQLLRAERTQLSAQEIELRTKAAIPLARAGHPDRLELAAWFAVANALLNLDETLSQ